ncbi:MAG TPA: phenylalanine--tRNA ligase subunit beta, partial [Calditrichae bacterium]|nr:phenylalanine--tRNA ligase subunit beta [Calditrichia bacterium]
IGGIMGGLNSEVSDATTDILLESAYFKPESIQLSARALGISTEASQRFERGTDPNGVLYAQERATQLLVELAGGEVLQGAVDVYPNPIHPVEIDLKPRQINTLLGTELSTEEMARILESIEFQVKGETVVVPTFRPDVTRTADLAEEIARLYGLDNIPAAEYTRMPYTVPVNESDRFVDELRTILTGFGLQEVLTNSMINASVWEKWTGEPVYPILNPISADMSGMRNTLVLSLLNVVQHNINRQVSNLRIFEINRVFKHPGNLNQLPQEELRVAVALTGLREPELWYSHRESVDFYDIKGICEALMDKISLDYFRFIYYDNFAVSEESLAVHINEQRIGYLGRLRPELLAAFDIEQPVYVLELAVSPLLEHRRKERKYTAIPRFPFVERDLAVVVDADVEAEKLIAAAQKVGGKYLQSISVFDVYRGKQVPEGKKSVALRFVFQSRERTLTEEEINKTMDTIFRQLQKEFGATLR